MNQFCKLKKDSFYMNFSLHQWKFTNILVTGKFFLTVLLVGKCLLLGRQSLIGGLRFIHNLCILGEQDPQHWVAGKKKRL